MREITQSPSPHMGGSLVEPRLIVLHYTAGSTAEGAISWFQDPSSKVSAHYVIGKDGRIFQCVPEDRVAWHCGRSQWRFRNGTTRQSINNHAIGIEFVNRGRKERRGRGKVRNKIQWLAQGDYEWERYTLEQLRSATWLIRDIRRRVPTIEDVVGHEAISPGRKVDPGPALPPVIECIREPRA